MEPYSAERGILSSRKDREKLSQWPEHRRRWTYIEVWNSEVMLKLECPSRKAYNVS